MAKSIKKFDESGAQVETPLSIQGDQPDLNYYQHGLQYDLPTTLGEAVGASVKSAFDDWTIFQPGKIAQLEALKSKGEMISPEQANTEYLADKPYTAPVSRAYAEQVSRDTMDRRELQSIIAKGPTGFAARGLTYGAGLAIGALDPGFFGLTLATGGVAGALGQTARGAAIAERIGEAGAMAARIGTEVTAAEGLHFAAQLEDRQNVDAGDFLAGSVRNTLFAGVAHLTMPYLKRFGNWSVNRVQSFFRAAGEEVELGAERAAIGQMANDQAVNIEPLKTALIKETNGTLPDGTNPVEFRPVSAESPITGRNLYHPSPDAMADFGAGTRAPIEGDYGQGVYMSDNPKVANGYASRSFNQNEGKVFETKVADGANLLNLDQKLTGDARSAVQPILEQILDKYGSKESAGELLDSHSGKEIFDEIRDAIHEGHAETNTFDNINADLKQAGFDGIHYQGGEYLGESNEPHNVAMMFSEPGAAPDKVSVQNEYIGNSEVNQKMSMADYRQTALNQTALENDLMFDPVAHQELRDAIASPNAGDIDVPEVKELEAQAMEQLQELEAQGLVSGDIKDAVEEIRQAAIKAAESDKAAKLAISCLGRNG